MKKILENCNIYSYNFPKSDSIREAFFSPQIILQKDNTVAELIQRWLIDYGDFSSSTTKTLSDYVLESKYSYVDSNDLLNFLDYNYFVSSKAGQFFYAFASSIVFRSFEFFYQGTKHSLNFTIFSPKIKELINLSILPTMLGLLLYSGYQWDYIMVIAIPILLEKVLSFTWSNYFKQVNALSGTKNFELKDFILKNFQFACLRTLPFVFVLLYDPQYFRNYKPAQISVCPVEASFKVDLYTASSTIEEVLLEPIALILGKICFDLACIFSLKIFSKDADLRDPMSSIFSRTRQQPILKNFKKPVVCEASTYSKKTEVKKPTKHSDSQNEVRSAMTDDPFAFKSSKNNDTKGRREIVQSSQKIKTKGKEPEELIRETSKISIKPKSSIQIETGNSMYVFQRIESSAMNKEVWGIIIADSVEKQKLTKYERLLSNGTIGGGVRQLTGWSDRFEIGANMDSRLIGRLYDNGIYLSLQNHMRMEEALQLSQELERHEIPDNMSLIVFSAEAKTHKDIARVASKL